VRALAAKISYVINPADPYPKNFTGHIRATLKDGRIREVRKPHMRGGAHEPLTVRDIVGKFHQNARFGGWPEARIAALAKAIDAMTQGGAQSVTDLSAGRE
jgi:2-methylcitrate dehydratase PrpD